MTGLRGEDIDHLENDLEKATQALQAAPKQEKDKEPKEFLSTKTLTDLLGDDIEAFQKEHETLKNENEKLKR